MSDKSNLPIDFKPTWAASHPRRSAGCTDVSRNFKSRITNPPAASTAITTVREATRPTSFCAKPLMKARVGCAPHVMGRAFCRSYLRPTCTDSRSYRSSTCARGRRRHSY